jgi:8-oxo-dGTP pyrophosphatase MutT (NUDIX family)
MVEGGQMTSVTETPVRPASTVVVMRDAPGGPEVFLVRRHHAVAFMAGAHVFPGGRIDDGDRAGQASWCDGVESARLALADQTPDESLAAHVAALRELFEEVGVLLARRPDGEFASFDSTEPSFAMARTAIHDGERSLHEVVTGAGLRLALDAVIYFAHWVTPPLDIRRFDTRFFLARVPEGQSPAHEERESTEGTWVRPADALAGAISGRFILPPPTWATLRELEYFPTVAAALEWARQRPVRRREPRVTLDGDLRRITLPGDSELPEPDPVAFETRFVLADGRWRLDLP